MSLKDERLVFIVPPAVPAVNCTVVLIPSTVKAGYLLGWLSTKVKGKTLSTLSHTYVTGQLYKMINSRMLEQN